MKTLTLIIAALLFSTISYAQSINSTDSTVLNFRRYLSKNIKYLDTARKLGIQGTLVVTFAINSEKKIEDVVLHRYLIAEQDSEVVRKVRNYNKIVDLPKAKYTIVLRFFIQDDDEKNDQPRPVDRSKYSNYLFDVSIVAYPILNKITSKQGH